MTAALIGYYTITPTHCGTGQAAGGVDLPIAREPHTNHPIFPASSVKGAFRERFSKENESSPINDWFGPDLNTTTAQQIGGSELRAGSITFGEARLLAFPVRALHTSFCYVTCPLILERFERDLRAYGLSSFWNALSNGDSETTSWPKEEATVGTAFPQEGPLVLEDLAFDARSNDVGQNELVDTLGGALGMLLPENEKAIKKRLSTQLVLLRDDYFCDLVRRTSPIQPRVHLDENKTTTGAGGNLWYEESLPSDSLLASFVKTRSPKENEAQFFDRLNEATAHPLQIGGNETVGQGLCLWQEGERRNG